ncbi:predicted protein [Histoplasma capsulatum var. duboisii H88]|uniref:Predicted protein n=2 Tax=Ajellomyces capsulatus TaxID=5037 RepID=F0UBA3_AJEC8|nr:predicted protein [Histoplasma capsulatum H143]EGC43012.1 predicted protein [Histoplasma capsulatum var. duboisii H88]
MARVDPKTQWGFVPESITSRSTATALHPNRKATNDSSNRVEPNPMPLVQGRERIENGSREIEADERCHKVSGGWSEGKVKQQRLQQEYPDLGWANVWEREVYPGAQSTSLEEEMSYTVYGVPFTNSQNTGTEIRACLKSNTQRAEE